jgi:hypothetical protein
VQFEREEEWRITRRFEIPRGLCPAALNREKDPDLLFAGREAILVGSAGALLRVSEPVDPSGKKKSPASTDGAFAIHATPTAACFASPRTAWVGDSEGEVREYALDGKSDPVARGRFAGAVMALRRLEGGAILALGKQGHWGLWEAGPHGPPRVGRTPCDPVRLAAVAFHAPLFALFGGGEILLAGPTGRKNPEWIRPPGRVHALALHPEARWMAVGNERGDVDLLDPGGAVLRSFHLGSELVQAVEVSPDGEWIAASTLGGGIWLFRVEEGSKVQSPRSKV